MKEFKGAKSSELGQAVTEYLLILLIVMIIALGALYQFNTAFANFAQNYFGEYLACLLETGELPNLGASQGTTCDSEFEEFSLANGRRKQLAPNPPRSNYEPTAQDRGGEEEAAAEEEEDGGSQARGGPGSQRGRRGSLRSRGPRRLTTAAAPGESEDASNAQRSISDPGSSSGRSYRGRTFASSKKGPERISSNFAVEKKQAKPEVKTAASRVDEGSDARKKKLIVKRQKKKVELEEDEPFTFSKFIKYLLIAGIIIAIVIFLGGQILQFSKGGDD